MDIENQLELIESPKKYIRNNKYCYFDMYRKRLIEITPEETIRQRVARYFETHLHVPHDMISIEVPICHYVEGVKGRADIIIHKLEDGNSIIPIAIIECKSTSNALTDQVYDQVIGYADALGAEYIIVTNGINIELSKYDESSDTYKSLDRLLFYEEMVNQVYIPQQELEHVPRFNLEELSDLNTIGKFNEDNYNWVYGIDTPPSLRPIITNLYQCLMDTDHVLPNQSNKFFVLDRDIGIRFLDYGNAGGGHYIGFYRSFLVKDRKNDSQIISISLFGTDPNFRGEERHSYSSLVVAIDQFKNSHNSLQYNMDKYVEIKDDSCLFVHNGNISRRSSKKLLQYISQMKSDLPIDQNKIILGKISFNKLLYVDDNDVTTLIYNLIEYAILRDEYHKISK